MKYFIVVVALAAVAAARPQAPKPEVIAIVRQVQDVAHDGTYNYAFETQNGIAASEDGVLRAAKNEEGHAIEARGQFAYTAPDGTPIQVVYVADENGFQPQGAHLPVAPPVPEAIQRALEYIAAHPQKPEEKKH